MVSSCQFFFKKKKKLRRAASLDHSHVFPLFSLFVDYCGAFGPCTHGLCPQCWSVGPRTPLSLSTGPPNPIGLKQHCLWSSQGPVACQTVTIIFKWFAQVAEEKPEFNLVILSYTFSSFSLLGFKYLVLILPSLTSSVIQVLVASFVVSLDSHFWWIISSESCHLGWGACLWRGSERQTSPEWFAVTSAGHTGVSLACDQFGVKVLSQGSLDYMCRVEWNSRTVLEIQTDQWVPFTAAVGSLGDVSPSEAQLHLGL